jgi:uncharacterized surface protein with fasciclin (FAS1) repeats
MRTMLLLLVLTACSSATPGAPVIAVASVAPAPVAKPPKSAAQKTVADVAIESPDHTTLVAALQAAGLVDALNSPGGVYTVFAPTNAAFEALPAGTVDSLLLPENKATLAGILKHHAAVPILALSDLQDGQQIGMSDGKKDTIHKDGDVVHVDGALIVGTVHAMNGVVYVVDGVLLPPA